jgi:hypothetical protein
LKKKKEIDLGGIDGRTKEPVLKFTVTHNFPEVQRMLGRLHKDVAEQAMARAINRTLDQGKTRMQRAIVAEFNVKPRVVRESLRVKRASRAAGLYAISGFLESPSKRGRSRNLIHFGAVQTKRGVTVKVKRSGSRKLIPGAFIINAGNQYGGTVMIRRGKQRLPINARQTIDVAQMFNTRRVNDLVVRFMEDKFPEVFAREAKFYLDRFNRSRA